ncbi:hypothetical protein CKK34_4281 [Yarrowia sp. E02]|nr:hypothetical protein CKK34_4281 [Yarrowia sp. E02]
MNIPGISNEELEKIIDEAATQMLYKFMFTTSHEGLGKMSDKALGMISDKLTELEYKRVYGLLTHHQVERQFCEYVQGFNPNDVQLIDGKFSPKAVKLVRGIANQYLDRRALRREELYPHLWNASVLVFAEYDRIDTMDMKTAGEAIKILVDMFEVVVPDWKELYFLDDDLPSEEWIRDCLEEAKRCQISLRSLEERKKRRKAAAERRAAAANR